MRYFTSPKEYEEQTGKTFIDKCPNIQKPLRKHILRKPKPYWPHWADIVEYNARLYWVNAKE